MSKYVTSRQMNEAIDRAIRDHELATANRGHRGLYMLTASLDDFGLWEPLRIPISTGTAGIICASAGLALGLDLTAAGEVVAWSVVVGGVASGISEIAPALANPLTSALEWLAARLQKTGPTTRTIPFNDRGKERMVEMPLEPERPEYLVVRIPSQVLKDGWREVNVEKLCGFLKSASNTGLWQKRKQNTYGWDEWADIRRWIIEEYPGVWGKTPPTQFLYAALPKIRARATNPTNHQPTNQATRLECVGRLPSWFFAAARDVNSQHCEGYPGH